MMTTLFRTIVPGCPLRRLLPLAAAAAIAGCTAAALPSVAETGPSAQPAPGVPPAAQVAASVPAPLPELPGAEEGFTAARKAFATGDLATAERYARAVLERFPGTVWQKRSLFLLGRTLLSAGRSDEAAAVLQRVPAEYPVLADYAYFLLAEHYADRAQIAGAIDLYRRLITDYPASSLVPQASFRLGQVLLAEGLSAEAASAFDRTFRDFRWSPVAPRAGIGLAKALAAAGDLAGAVGALQQVSVRFPGGPDDEVEALRAELSGRGAAVPPLSAEDHYQRARRLFRAALYEKAYASFTAALEADPGHARRADILLRSGIALYHLGRRPQAASMLERLLEAKLPDCRCDEALNWLGRSYSRLGLREEALATYGKLVKRYPDSEWADDALYLSGNVYRDAGDMTRALRSYRRLADGYPDSPLADSALWWEAWDQYSGGRDGQAIKTLGELVRRYPRSFLVNQALYWQGRAAERAGMGEQATKYYERLLRRGPYSYYGYRAAERLAATGGTALRLAAQDAEDEEYLNYSAALEPDEEDEDGAVSGNDLAADAEVPDWSGEVVEVLSASPAYQKTLELMHLGMRPEAAAELALLQNLRPRRSGALMGLSKAYFELGDYYRSLIIILRNFERILERPSQRYAEDLWLLAYPQGYWSSIMEHARTYGVDPFLVAAIIRQESMFHAEALSPAGARGVMQVMPSTGAWIARSAGINGYEHGRLYDEDVNIRLGAWYLSFLMKRFQGNLFLVSAAYNAGPGAVRSWVGTNGGADDPAAFVEAIPYTETRGYVKKVLRNYDEYRRLYGTGESPAALPGKASRGEAGAAGQAKAVQVCSAANCP